MAITSTLLVLIFYVSKVASWTYTEYLTIITAKGFDSSNTTTMVTVSPTGSVSPTRTDVTTTQTSIGFGYNYAWFNITVTDLYLGPNASACAPYDLVLYCGAPTVATRPTTLASTIDTSVWAPVTISNPSTCTLTSFTYTTSSLATFQATSEQTQFPTIFNEATDTGPNGEALFITTYISTVSIDLGGQAITTTRCDIWLKNGAFVDVSLNDDEIKYLKECVDPRRYLCPSGSYDSATCGTNWVGTYATAGSTTLASTTSKGGGPASSSTTKASGVAEGKDLYGGLMLTALAAVASLCILLC